jgi:hypothetical protein
MLEPVDRTFFSPGCQCRSVGPCQRTRGSSPRSPAGVWALLQGFFREFLPVCGALGSTGIGDIPAGLARTRMTGNPHVWCILGGVAVRQSPEPGPIRGNRGELSVFF